MVLLDYIFVCLLLCYVLDRLIYSLILNGTQNERLWIRVKNEISQPFSFDPFTFLVESINLYCIASLSIFYLETVLRKKKTV